MERAHKIRSMQKNKGERRGCRGHRIISLAATIRQQNQEEIASDILGSYTGLTDEGEEPVQDADDL